MKKLAFTQCVTERQERREDIFDTLVDDHHFEISEIVDFTEFEQHDKIGGYWKAILDRKTSYVMLLFRNELTSRLMQFWMP